MGRTARNGQRATAEFREYLRADWLRWLSECPELATWVGHRGLNDRWTDDSPAGIEARRAHLAESRALLAGIDRRRLPAPERLNFDLYAELLATATTGLDYGDDPMPFRFTVPRNLWIPLTQLEGVHIAAADALELQPRETRADYDALLGRLERLPAAVAQHRALLDGGAARGFTPPRVVVESVPAQIDRLLPEEPEASALLVPFRSFPPRIGRSERSRYRAEARRIYRDRLVPSFRDLRDHFARNYLPACREAVGINAVPQGRAAYEFRIRWQTTTGLTARAIHAVGLSEVRRLRREMRQLARQAGFRGGLDEFRAHLRSDPRHFYTRSEDLVDGYRVLGKRCDPMLAALFGRLPRQPWGVQAVPSFRAENAPAAFYAAGAPEVGRPGWFYVNTHALGERARWEMEALTLHESVPGHHLQISLAQEREDLPEFRRHNGYTAFVEGWGLYAESLGGELGFFTDPLSKFGQLSFDMWRSVRLVVDTGLHALGWSRDRAVRFFRESTGTSEQEIGVEVDRYIVWPGQALAYKIGAMRIADLRRRAEEALGDRFDVRAFHDTVLADGALPLERLELRVLRWIEASRASRGARASLPHGDSGVPTATGRTVRSPRRRVTGGALRPSRSHRRAAPPRPLRPRGRPAHPRGRSG